MDIVESAAVTGALAAAKDKFPRLDEIMKGWKWRLIHDPQQGYPIPGTNPQRYIAKSAPYKQYGIPAIRIKYYVADNKMQLESIHVE